MFNNWEAKTRGAIFAVQLVYLLALWLVVALYQLDTINPPREVGTIPIGVLWYGALGAVLVSMKGVFDHANDWDASYAYWHWSRPIFGASLAVISVLIFQAGILSVGADVAEDKVGLTYFLIAFLVGYREETFRQLIKRLADVILTPPEEKTDEQEEPETEDELVAAETGAEQPGADEAETSGELDPVTGISLAEIDAALTDPPLEADDVEPPPADAGDETGGGDGNGEP